MRLTDYLPDTALIATVRGMVSVPSRNFRFLCVTPYDWQNPNACPFEASYTVTHKVTGGRICGAYSIQEAISIAIELDKLDGWDYMDVFKGREIDNYDPREVVSPEFYAAVRATIKSALAEVRGEATS